MTAIQRDWLLEAEESSWERVYEDIWSESLEILGFNSIEEFFEFLRTEESLEIIDEYSREERLAYMSLLS